jgi:DedD protein
VIQLGAFAEAGRAKDRHAQLVKAGIKSYTEVIKTPTGDKTRVRAGPFPTREAADKANERVKALGITDGVVVTRRY